MVARGTPLPSNLPEPDPREVAWAAGLFEGEGCFYYRPNAVSAHLAMVDFDTVRRFAAIVGVGSLNEQRKRPQGCKPVLYWRVSNRAGVEYVVELFRPWLGARRLAQAEDALRRRAERTAETNRQRDHACKNGHVRTAENTEHRIHNRTGMPFKRCRDCYRERLRRERARYKAQRAA